MTQIVTRPYSPELAERLEQAGTPPLLARLYAARGIDDPSLLNRGLADLFDYRLLKNIQSAAARLADAIERGERLLIVADYDADGATACAVGIRGLRALGACIDYLVPNRFEYGYGLSPEIVRLAAERAPDMIITVDNGIAAHAGVEEARRLGIEVLVTDHHLPAETLPDTLIVNPNQPGCGFPSKHLAGVGVMFYVLLALRAELRQRGRFANKVEPNLARLLDLVALGTVADVVPLDANNRLLVEQGLRRMRRGQQVPGLQALFQVSGRDPERAGVQDLGFLIGPRLNAAGRLADMSLGIECLLADDDATAQRHALELDRLNRERRGIESEMQAQALDLLDGIDVGEGYSLALYDPAWHQGVVGLLASRLKERHHRPTFAFASAGDGLLKASGRSIPGLHLRDLLDLIDKRHPGLLLKFGGHAAAAGLSLEAGRFDEFATVLETTCRSVLGPAELARVIETDGELSTREFCLASAEAIQSGVWGQAFPAPAFIGDFRVQSQRLVGEKHLKLKLTGPHWSADAMLFNRDEPVPERIQAVYRLDVNAWNGQRSLQLTLDHWTDAATA
ncbi:MAG: single-stranded-DNA-specific exonuclease RecJ [Hydrogenophilales bacterium]|nr:single-stranded-DNA-specific exonuclease RecJ [Hydrogenophilales bacterium]